MLCLFFWSVDRGIVCNLMLIVLISFTINKNFKSFLNLSLSIIFTCWYFILFYNEFNYFIDNTASILNEMNIIGGIIHPLPFLMIQIQLEQPRLYF